ncbi:unnamed protein product [Mytilus coruscus]|uniref:Uncharacterized protein n=1 Tax=Mytilus coruscus TaxID=42192 RepID=A0A6J8BVR7_MYTCO|nr:unnamed protein product [Mytilus coruscus]
MELDQSRDHSARCEAGNIPPNKGKNFRDRRDNEKLEHSLPFFPDPNFIQICSYGTKDIRFDNGDIITISQLRSNLSGLDNIATDGTFAVDSLLRVIDTIDELRADRVILSTISAALKNLKLYLKSDYKFSISWSDICGTHCILYALSNPGNVLLQDTCSHCHENSYMKCKLLTEAKSKLENEVQKLESDDVKEELENSINKDFEKHRTFTHLCGMVKQDWFAVASALDRTLTTIREQMSQIQEVFLRSDNANCYHCGCLWLSLHGISERTGIIITHYNYSEAQSGKSIFDAKIAHMRLKMRMYVSSGRNITSQFEMQAAIMDGT